MLFFWLSHYDNLFISRQGQDFGDEYFAELDMIESVEGRKEGYESDVDEGEYYLQENDLTVIQWKLICIYYNEFKFSMIVELLNETVEKDDSVSDEESSKDGDFNLPNYFR